MTEKKITAKHYLNKRAKAKIYKDQSLFPLYIQIIVMAKKAQIKSRVYQHLSIYGNEIEHFTKHDLELRKLVMKGYFTDNLLDNIKQEKIFPLFQLLEDEIQVIKRIIGLHKPFEDENFTLKNLTGEYIKHTKEITDILDNKIKDSYRKNLNEIFLHSVDKKEEKDIFNFSNFFIHYINWDNSFYNYYQITYEVIPSELKYIENFIDDGLKVSIKAYLAYHSKINLMKRALEKKEHGRISTLSYLDWITDVKEFITKEFTRIFGKKKALQYVESLDNILARNIREP